MANTARRLVTSGHKLGRVYILDGKVLMSYSPQRLSWCIEEEKLTLLFNGDTECRAFRRCGRLPQSIYIQHCRTVLGAEYLYYAAIRSTRPHAAVAIVKP